MSCRLCGADSTRVIEYGQIFGYSTALSECTRCAFVQVEDPCWLEEAYENAINASDTGLVARNLANTNLVMATLSVLGAANDSVLDWAGGCGLLVRLLRDNGVDAFWSDLYSENILAKGFEGNRDRYAVCTAFECFEHLIEPIQELGSLFALSDNVLASTSLISDPAPKLADWWYYGVEHGQHIGFYRLKTLAFLAKQYGRFLISDGHSVHLFSSVKVNNPTWRAYRGLFRFGAAKNLFGYRSKTWSDHCWIKDQ